MNKICHFTSVHPIDDIRIFHKECVSLAANGYDVTLIACGENSFEDVVEGVKRISLSVPVKNRLQRFFKRSKAVYKKAIEVNADIYHFHDPELIPIGLKLKKNWKKVIFDSHEDVPNQILAKEWLPSFIRKLVSFVYRKYETMAVKKFDGLITVTPTLTDRLKKINKNTVQITNYPLLRNNEEDIRLWRNSICFAGGISRQWLHENLICALDNIPNITYRIAGHKDETYYEKLKKLKSWNKVDYVGKLPFDEVFSFISESSVGIALNNYNANVGHNMGSLGNTKIFEYMQAGIPVICTDFILWKRIIDEYNCGICVNPYDIDEIKEAILYFINNPQITKEMGNNGRKAIINNLNWNNQVNELLKFYNKF